MYFAKSKLRFDIGGGGDGNEKNALKIICLKESKAKFIIYFICILLLDSVVFWIELKDNLPEVYVMSYAERETQRERPWELQS